MKIMWISVYFVVLIWSGIHPKDYFTWILEVAPAVIGFGVLVATHTRSFVLPTWPTPLC